MAAHGVQARKARPQQLRVDGVGRRRRAIGGTAPRLRRYLAEHHVCHGRHLQSKRTLCLMKVIREHLTCIHT